MLRALLPFALGIVVGSFACGSSPKATGSGATGAAASGAGGATGPSSASAASGSGATGTGGTGAGGSAGASATGAGTGGAAACAAPSGYTASNLRGGVADTLPLSGYDYAPSVVETASHTFQMWWCGLNSAAGGGDEIRYAEASSLDGPWHAHGSATANTFDVALTAGGNGSHFFDTTDACDPSVVQVPDGTYYLYYGGNGAPWTGAPNDTTQIGVASSVSGLPGTWTKLDGEGPIVTPQVNQGSASYGAGQPSVVVAGDFLYMMYTDTTGADGSGIYVLRTMTSDPTFAAAQTFDGDGFVPLSTATKTSHRVTADVDGDWYYADAVGAFVLAVDDTFSTIKLTVLRPTDFSILGTAEVTSGGNGDGPGIVRTAAGHAPPSPACGVLPVDLMRADCYLSAGDTTDCDMDPYGGTSQSNVNLWDLAHVGVDLDVSEPCACVQASPVGWPWVDIDAPAAGATVSGTVHVGGWALDNIDTVGPAIDPAAVEVWVDGTLAGHATYGGSRPDVCNVYPGRAGCPDVGYDYLLDVTALAAGAHTITVVAGTTDPLPVQGTASVIVNR